MTTSVIIGKIENVGPDYIVWRNGDDKRRVEFKDSAMFTKEDSALCFRGHEGKPAAIPIDGPFFIAMDFMPGDFEGSLKVAPFHLAVESVKQL